MLFVAIWKQNTIFAYTKTKNEMEEPAYLITAISGPRVIAVLTYVNECDLSKKRVTVKYLDQNGNNLDSKSTAWRNVQQRIYDYCKNNNLNLWSF